MTRLQIMQILNETMRAEMCFTMPLCKGHGLACEQIVKALEEEQKKVREIMISPEMLPQVVKAGTSENEYWNILKQKKGMLVFRWEEKE